jgi:hypothetical protein
MLKQYKAFKNSLYNIYVVASLQHPEDGNTVIFCIGLAARINDMFIGNMTLNAK